MFIILIHNFELLQGDDGDVLHPASTELDIGKTLKFVFIMKIYALCVCFFVVVCLCFFVFFY